MKEMKPYLQQVADDIWKAYESKTTIPQITKVHTDLTLDDAYQIQLLTVQKALAGGRKIAGKKIGLTSKAMQQMFNIDVPDYGHLYDSMIWSEDEPISLKNLHKPRIEAEIAFILGEDLMGPGVNLTDVIRATAGIVPCFEIIDSRITNWEIKVTDSVSDNASAAGITLGAGLHPIGDYNLKHVGLVLEQNGKIIDTAAGAAVMGHPALSVAWLANKMGEYGVPLKKGEIILSGSLIKAVPANAGDVFVATYDRLGSVKAFFVE